MVCNPCCEHCQATLRRGDSIVVREGRSYHTGCHKCIMCSETNLHGAYNIMGVLLCRSCSRRIFSKSPSAREKHQLDHHKNGRRRNKVKKGCRRDEEKCKETDAIIDGVDHNIIELVKMSCFGEKNSNNFGLVSNVSRKYLSLPYDSTPVIPSYKSDCYTKPRGVLGRSTETGTTTLITSDVLQQVKSARDAETTSLKKIPQKYRTIKESNDLRVAGIGASTEIATTALRKQSVCPDMRKSQAQIDGEQSLTLSALEDSDLTDGSKNWAESYMSSSSGVGTEEFSFINFIKMPFRFFKQNILAESSLVALDEDYVRQRRSKLMKKARKYFFEEIADHQGRGLKKLYSTINRYNEPYKLGWLATGVVTETKECQHVRKSHSYRCMRSKVMRLAGPTKSQLRNLRVKSRAKAGPKRLMKSLFSYNKQYTTIVTSL